MIDIRRSRSNPNGAFSTGCMDDINTVQDTAHDLLIAHLVEVGPIEGDNYYQAVLPAENVDQELLDSAGNADGGYFVSRTETDLSVFTTVFNLETGQGAQKETSTTSDFTEIYPLQADSFTRRGSRLILELFKPGTYPELAELVESSKDKLVNPDELSARVMTEEEQQCSFVRTSLGDFTTKRLVRVINDYYKVAYPGEQVEPSPTTDHDEIVRNLQDGEPVGLRLDTAYLSCAKLQMSPRKMSDALDISMYLNYEIPFGPVSLYFRDDITMAVQFADRIRRYLD